METTIMQRTRSVAPRSKHPRDPLECTPVRAAIRRPCPAHFPGIRAEAKKRAKSRVSLHLPQSHTDRCPWRAAGGPASGIGSAVAGAGEPMASTRIVLADEHQLTRAGLRSLLEGRGPFAVVGEASGGAEAVRLVSELRPDVAILEYRLPEMLGPEVIRRARAESLATRWIVVSSLAGREHVQGALRAGASGYLPKSAPVDELLAAVDQVRSGGTHLSTAIVHHVVDVALRRSGRGTSPVESLTRREREVCRLIAEGLSAKEIGVALGVATKTVEVHRSRLMKKVGVRKATGLVRLAIREGMIAA